MVTCTPKRKTLAGENRTELPRRKGRISGEMPGEFLWRMRDDPSSLEPTVKDGPRGRDPLSRLARLPLLYLCIFLFGPKGGF